MSKRYDLIVIGAGMAGVSAADKCAAHGWDVAIVDALPYGGTCALRGCDPKKILRRGAEIIDSAQLMRGKGIDPGNLSINWADLMKHKHGFTDPVPQNMERGLTGNGVATLHGEARFTDKNRIRIDGTDYEAGHFLIATGAHPRPLDFPGHQHLIDSTDFLNLQALPRRILFLGGGFISFEFAHIAARAGSSPVIIDRGTRPLKAFDPDLVELLITRGAEVGIEVRRSTTITAVEPTGSGYQVSVERAGKSETMEVDLVVHGAGRTPQLSGLHLDAAAVASGARGVRVAGHLQSTTNPAVYAAGDSADTPGLPLTPIAVSEGKVAASNMLKGTTTVPDYTGVPTAVFTIPELSRVGLLEQDATDQGMDVHIRYHDTSSWFSNYRIGETTAAAKVLIDRSSDRIVGAHLLGPEYGELINILGLAIKLNLTTRQLKSVTAAYPTVGSDLGRCSDTHPTSHKPGSVPAGPNPQHPPKDSASRPAKTRPARDPNVPARLHAEFLTGGLLHLLSDTAERPEATRPWGNTPGPPQRNVPVGIGAGQPSHARRPAAGGAAAGSALGAYGHSIARRCHTRV